MWNDKPPDIHVERLLFRLTHGLPGSGKSKLIAWLKQYFDEVWQWAQGKQYAIVAPMNTMADNIGGTTIHSFGRIPFKDKRGMVIHPGKNTETSASIFADDPWHELRFVLLDEVEACGVSIFGRLEESLRANVPSSNSAYQALQKKDLHPDRVRSIAFAGVNMLCFGDFWQLDPTGDTSFMSNPTRIPGSAIVDRTMAMFWQREGPRRDNLHLQEWTGKHRVWELSENLRSGEDVWFSEVLDQCRVGQLSEENYNFLHGLPTRAAVTFWYHRREEETSWHECMKCTPTRPCEHCRTETIRRNRWLNMHDDPSGAATKLAAPKFRNCILVTPFNKAVFQFAIHRAQTFAASRGEPLF